MSDPTLKFRIGAELKELRAGIAEAKTLINELVTAAKGGGDTRAIDAIEKAADDAKESVSEARQEVEKLNAEASKAKPAKAIDEIKKSADQAKLSTAEAAATVDALVKKSNSSVQAKALDNITEAAGKTTKGVHQAANAFKDLVNQQEYLNKLSATFNRSGGNAQTKNIQGIASSSRSAVSQVINLYAAIQAINGLRGLGNIADDIANMTAQLKLATNNADELGIAQAGLLDISNRSGTALSQSVDLYTKLARSTKDTNIAQGELLRLTETIGKSASLSGSSIESTNAALVQFAQGLAGGKFQAEEINSVIEQTPRLAQAIAEGLGTTTGKLKKMVNQGLVTTESVIIALGNQAKKIDEEYSKLPPTIGRASTQIKNNFMTLIGQLDSATGASGNVAQKILDVSTLLNTFDFSGLVEFVSSSSEAFGVIGDGMDDVGAAATQLAELLGSAMVLAGRSFNDELGQGSDAIDSLDFLKFTIKNLPSLVVAAIQELTVNLAAFGEKAYASAAAIKERVVALYTDDTVDKVNQRLDKELARIEAVRRESIAQIEQETAAHIGAGEAAAARYKKEREEREKNTAAAKKAAAEADEKAKGKAVAVAAGPGVDNTAVLKADAENTLRVLDRLYDEGKVRLTDYYEQKRALSTQITNLEIAELNQKIAAADKVDEKSKLLTQQEIARRKGIATQADISGQEIKDKERRLRDAEAIQAELLQIEGKGSQARRIQLETQYRETLDRMKVEGDQAGIDIVNKLINSEVAKSRLSEVEKEYQKTVDTLRAKEASLANQVQVGAKPEATADVELQGARDQAAESLQKYRAELQLLAQQDIPGANESLASLDASLQQIAIDSETGVQSAMRNLRSEISQFNKDLAATTANAGVDALSGLFTDLATKSKSAGEALKDFVRGFVQSMAQIAARALATMLVLQLLDAIYPGLGKATAATMSAGVHHNGGVAGSPSVRRKVDPSLFAAAPRYHVGGVAGLKPGEVPAILQTGEEVLSRDNPRNVMNGGGKENAGGGTRIINVIDPNLVEGYMSSSSGEKTIMNVIERNAGNIKQVLG